MVGRRGSAMDVLLIGVLLFAFGIAFLVMHFATNKIYDGLLNNSVVQSSNATVEALTAGKATTERLDQWVLGVFIGLTLALVITGWFISGNPLFMGIYVIVIILAVLISMILSNAWEVVSQRPEFVSSLLSLPITNHLLSNLPYYVAVIGVLGLIVVFAKPSFNPGGDLRVG